MKKENKIKDCDKCEQRPGIIDICSSDDYVELVCSECAKEVETEQRHTEEERTKNSWYGCPSSWSKGKCNGLYNYVRKKWFAKNELIREVGRVRAKKAWKSALVWKGNKPSKYPFDKFFINDISDTRGDKRDIRNMEKEDRIYHKNCSEIADMRFKIGDRVKIINDFPISEITNYQLFPYNIPDLEGKKATITSISVWYSEPGEKDWGYYLDIDDFRKLWSSEKGQNNELTDYEGWCNIYGGIPEDVLWNESFIEPIKKIKKDIEYKKNKYYLDDLMVGDYVIFNCRKFNFGEQSKVLGKLGNLICLDGSLYGDGNRWHTIEELKSENVLRKYK